MFEKIVTVLSNINLIEWLIKIGIALAGFIILTYQVVKYILYKEAILYRNRKRPIKIFSPHDRSMELEVKTLRKSNLFHLDNPTSELRDLHNIRNHSLIVIGYTSGMAGFDDFVKEVMRKDLPMIIYTFGDSRALSPEQLKLLHEYPWYTITISPLRLMSDIFTILSTFPYEKGNH